MSNNDPILFNKLANWLFPIFHNCISYQKNPKHFRGILTQGTICHNFLSCSKFIW